MTVEQKKQHELTSHATEQGQDILGISYWNFSTDAHWGQNLDAVAFTFSRKIFLKGLLWIH